MTHKIGDRVYLRAESKEDNQNALKVTKIEGENITVTGPDTQTRVVKEAALTDVEGQA